MKLSLLTVLTLLTSAVLTAQGPNFTPPTPLIGAAMRNDTALAKKLLDDGANPNEGRLIGFTPIFFAIISQNLDLVKAMAAKGADLNATDGAGSTPLMWAASDEAARPEIVEELLKLGADPHVVNKMGDTALTWAARRGETAIVASLTKAGARDKRTQEAAERALRLMQKSADQFTKASGCTSCHHQSVPQMANGLARQRGLAVDEKIAKQQAAAVIAIFAGAREVMLQGTDRIPDPSIGVSYALLGLHAEGYAPDETTEAMAHLVSTKQRPDGSFPSLPARPPIESSDISATALTLRALRLYGKQPDSAVERARNWLLQASAHTNEERSMQLLGLAWANAHPDQMRPFATALMAEQQANGGWSQLPQLEPDAYATGQALYALHEAHQLTTSHPAYRSGVNYLLRTQMADGSWHVRSRVFPFQPLKESGFPHGKDQWISASGTGWATMALTLATPAVKVTESSGQ